MVQKGFLYTSESKSSCLKATHLYVNPVLHLDYRPDCKEQVYYLETIDVHIRTTDLFIDHMATHTHKFCIHTKVQTGLTHAKVIH